MKMFSVLCTNTRNGGQCELLIEAESAFLARYHVTSTRPHYIIKKTDIVESTFVCIGWNTRHGIYNELAYVTSSADEARTICQKLHPDFAIDRVEKRE